MSYIFTITKWKLAIFNSLSLRSKFTLGAQIMLPFYKSAFIINKIVIYKSECIKADWCSCYYLVLEFLLSE